MKNRIYVEYLIEFYSKQAKGLIEPESRPLYFKKVVDGDDEIYLNDLVDVIEKLKHKLR